MGENARTWQGLLQRVVEANREIVSTKRLKGHLDRLAEKYPPLNMVSVTEGRVELREGFPEDESGLVTVCTILGALYWTLDMFTGPTTAAERIRKPVRDFIEGLPPGRIIGLNRFLPKLHLEKPAEGEPPEEPARQGEKTSGPAGPPAGTGAPGGDRGGTAPSGEQGRELWERSTENGTTDTGQGARDDGGGEAEAAELPGEELAAQFSGTVPWLGEEIPRGCSLLVEGPGEAKERCSLKFLGEGLAGGESVLALIAYPPDEFRRRMAAEGYDTKAAEQEGRLRMLDWATFRERHIQDLEDDGPVMRLPMELPWVGSAMNMALSELPESASPRAFVNILPRALATVAIETVFNFVQVTILKFKRKKMTGLFIMEEEKDPEKSAIRLSFNSWVDIGGGGDGAFSVRLGGPILRPKLKTVSFAAGKWTVEKEEAIPQEKVAGPEPSFMGELRQQIADWRSQGYDVSPLEEAVKGDPARARGVFGRFGEDAARLKTIRSDLRIMDLAGFEEDAARIQNMLLDVGRVEQAELAMRELRKKLDHKRAAARERPPGPRPAMAGEAAGPELPGAGAEAAASSEARAAAGTKRRGELRKEEEAVRRAQEEARKGEEAQRRAREAAAGEEKRREFREALLKWKDEGYSVGALEEVIDQDLERVRRDFLVFRVQLQRLRELGEELAAVDAPALAPRRAELEAMLRDAARIPELEKGVEELRSAATAIKEEERQRREEEQRRRAALSEKVFWWSSHGLHVERLEKLLDGDLTEAERETSAVEPGAQRLLRLREELAAMDTSEFREAAAKLESLLGDVEQVERAELELAAFKEFVAKHSRDARERAALRDGLEGWRARGFRTDVAEKALDRDPETARAEIVRFIERAGASESLLAQLSGLSVKGFESRAEQVRECLRDPYRLEDGRVLLAALHADIESAQAEELQRAECRQRLDGWKKGGFPTGELERLLDRDLPTLRRAVLDFQFRLDAHDELAHQLEPLAQTRYAGEAAGLLRELKDLSRLPELEEKVLALRSRIEAEALASGREMSGEFERDFANMEKVRRWIAGGIQVRRLEGALRLDQETLRAEIDRYEQDIEELSKEGSALEVLDTKGLEKELAHIRSMLNDPDKLPVVRALRDSLRAEIARLKKQEERRSNLRGVARDWEQRGYRVKHLHDALEKDLEKAAQSFVLFQTRIAAAEHLRRRIDALELLGMRSESERLRRRLAESDSLEEVRAEVDRLWKAAEESDRNRAAWRTKERERRRALEARAVGWLERGLDVRRLEKALQRPLVDAEAEFSRFEEDVRRLRTIEERLAGLEAPGFESDILALKSGLADVDRIPELERGLEALREKMDRARRDDEQQKAQESARRSEEQRRSALRARMEDRLKEWSGFGLNVEALRTALATDLSLAEKRFAEFENSLYRSEELKVELHALEAEGLEGVAGADTIEKMLLDPLKLPQADKAFAEFRLRAESHLREKDAQMRGFALRIGELESRGEDVTALRRAYKKGLAEVRQAFADYDRALVNRERMETWKGIKSRLLSERSEAADGGAGHREGGPAAGEGAEAGGGEEADAAEGGERAADGKIARKKVRKVRK
jgi:KaiC/GvpD/RAD55 family RecA-like ATPase